MKDQLLLLTRLQTIDARVQELRSAMVALPEKLQPAKRDLVRLEGFLQQERDKISDTERWRKEQEELIKREEEAIRQAKTKLQASKNAKDFTAANRELDNKRRSLSEREEEVLKVIEALETTRRTMEQHAQDVEKLRREISEEEARIQVQVAALETEATESAAGRSEITAQIEPSLLKRYEVVVKRRGLAVVPVVNGVCQGCHMAIPPQLNNVIARNDSIESCPRCTRLLYRPDILEPGPEEAEPAAGEPAPAEAASEPA